MNPLKIEIPNYIRKVKMSESQIPVYYEWTGQTIKAKNKLIPNKYLKPELIESLITGIEKPLILPQHLKEGYQVGIFRGEELQGVLIEFSPTTGELIKWFKRDEDLNKTTLRKPKKYCVMNKDFTRTIANPKKVGTPRVLTIRGQDFYSGAVKEHVRGFLMKAIKQSFLPYVKDISPISVYPVRVRLYLFDTVKNVFDNSKADIEGTRWDVGNRTYPYAKAFLDLLVTGSDGTSIVMDKKIKDDDRLHVTEDPQGGVFCPIENEEDSKLVFIIAKDDKRFERAVGKIEKERRLLIEKSKHYARNGS